MGARDGTAPRYQVELRVRCDDAADADALRGAIQVEADDPLPRAEVTVRADAEDAHAFIVTVSAEEPAYFRAALNSYLKWLQAADLGLRTSDDA